MTKVYGDKKSAVPVTVGKSKVYVRTNITKSDDLSRGQYMWDEKTYTKDEYIEMLNKKNENLNSQLTDAQLALCESYEANVKLEEELTNTQMALCEVYELLYVE